MGRYSNYTVGDVISIGSTIQMDLYYPSDFLKDGIVIIDTPGIGGLDPRHANLTAMALPYADVAVFITDASEPMTESELKFFENKVSSRVENTIVLVNKSDIYHKMCYKYILKPQETPCFRQGILP